MIMTVGNLIDLLMKFPSDMQVKRYDDTLLCDIKRLEIMEKPDKYLCIVGEYRSGKPIVKYPFLYIV